MSILDQRTLKILGISCCIVGAGMTAAGIIMNGGNFDGIHFRSDSSTSADSTFSTSDVHNILIEDSNTSIVIETGDDGTITVNYDGQDQYYSTDTSNDTLSIRRTSKDSSVWSSHTLTITVPEYELQNLKISDDSSSISVTDVQCTSIEIKTSDGSITAENLSVTDSISLKTSNASLNMTDLKAGNDITAVTSNGSLSANDLSGRNISLSTSNGSLESELINSSGSLSMKTSNGRITADNIKAATEISLSTSNAAIEGYLDMKSSEVAVTCKNSSYESCNVQAGSGSIPVILKTSNASVSMDMN
jgi:DUF4097 and DUF4098 domain-containing protein YvlB